MVTLTVTVTHDDMSVSATIDTPAYSPDHVTDLANRCGTALIDNIERLATIGQRLYNQDQ